MNEKDKIINLYLNTDKNLTDIGRKFGKSRKVVTKIIKDAKVWDEKRAMKLSIKNRMIKLDNEKIIQLYENGETPEKIGVELNVDNKTIRRRLIKLGVYDSSKFVKKYNIEKKVLEKMYLDKKMTPVEIANKLNIKKAETVIRWLEKYDIYDENRKWENLGLKLHESKKINKSYGKSKEEDLLYIELCNEFGKENVKRQVAKDGFFFDFEIKRGNITQLVQYNGVYYHNYRMFNPNLQSHRVERKDMMKIGGQSKNISNKWIRDYEEYKYCKNNNLNVVFLYGWKGSISNIGFNKKAEWTNEELRQELYSIKNRKNIYYKNKEDSGKIIKSFSWNELFKNSIPLFKNNNIFKYYVNRIKYSPMKNNVYGCGVKKIGRMKLLSDFNKYKSQFNSYGTHSINNIRRFIRDYNINSIYDPFSGWGHRMIGAWCEDIKYIGYDINNNQVKNLLKLKEWLRYDECGVFVGDSERNKEIKTDGTYSCPPYCLDFNGGDGEKYTNGGAENLKTKDYFKWLNNIINNSPKPLCFQLPRNYLKFIPEEDKIIELKKTKHHFNRGEKRTKKSNEIIYIIEK